MRNKGFTLIELIGVIVLLSLMALIIIPGLSKSLKTGKEKADENTINSIILAAKAWAKDHKKELPEEGLKKNIFLSELQKEGYIDKDLTLPSKKTKIEEACVEIETIKKSKKTVYDYTYNEKCNTLDVLEIVGKTDFKEIPSDTWINENLTLTGVSKGYSGKYQWYTVTDDTAAKISNTTKFLITAVESEKSNITNYRLILNSDGKDYEANYIAKIDRKKPSITYTKKNSASNNLSITLTDTGSKLDSYAITKNENPTNDEWVDIKGESTYKATITLQSGTYNLIAKDVAGNISKEESIKIISVDPPTCTITASGTSGENSWYKGNVTLTMKVTGTTTKKGLATTKNSTNGKVTATQTNDTKSVTYYGYVENEGGSSTCSKTVKKDATKPTCSWSGESTTWTKNNRTIKVTGNDSTSGMNTSYQTKSFPYTSNKKTASLSYIIKDNAGNTNTCSKTANIYVDKTAPVCGEGECASTGNCGIDGGGAGLSSRKCGTTFWMKASDADSGVKAVYSRHCYHKVKGSVQTAKEWGQSCGGLDGSNDILKNWLKSNKSFAKAYFVNGYAAHGLNANNARVVFQFKVVDNAGNERECGSHVKSVSANTSECPSGIGF